MYVMKIEEMSQYVCNDDMRPDEKCEHTYMAKIAEFIMKY